MNAATNTFRVIRYLLGQWYIFLILGALVIGETWRDTAPDYFSSKGWLTRQIQELVPSRKPPQYVGTTCYFGPIPWISIDLDPETGNLLVSGGDMGGFQSRAVNAFTEERYDDLDSSALRGSLPKNLYVFAGFSEDHYGIWKRCFKRRSPSFSVGDEEGSPLYPCDPEFEAAARWVSVQEAPGWETHRQAADAVLRDHHPIVPIWPGIVHDSAMLLASFAFLSGFWFVPARFRATRRTRRAARGLCPGCAYDLARLTASICPECGQPISISADSN